MNRSIPILFLMLILTAGCNSSKVELKIGTVGIIPKPMNQTIGEGYFEINSNTNITVEDDEQMAIVNQLFGQFQVVAGWRPSVTIGEGGDISFLSDLSIEDEGYSLEVGKTEVQVKASTGSGFYYAMQTITQLLPVEYYKNSIQEIRWGVPVVSIQDKPAFGWRGYMLDVSRHFFSKEDVLKVIDFMAESKLNRFHWHLADDQGWRLEIKSYPKLTELGAWRMDYNTTDETVSNWWGRPAQKPGEKPSYGGFYTQEDVKEIITYAKERYIEVIPEIDMPGHAQATIAAYPEIGCVDAAPYVATGGVGANNTYNPGKEETFVFADKMLNELMDLFPFEYIHIGGDECNKSQWRVDPFAQKRMKEEGLENVEELQSYFLNRIEKIINKRDRIMIGWDEILEGGLAPNATVMSWRGEAGGIESAKAGHDVVMTPNKYCYIDLKQGHDDLEPNLGYSQLLLSTSYGYKVIPDELSDEEGKHILGIQANMWTESISDWSKLTYMTFPRVYAIAENGWTDYTNKSWDDFTERLNTQLKRLELRGIRYATSAYSPWIDHKGDGKSIEITLKTEVNGLAIHYTTDGTEPSTNSTLYNGPFTVKDGASIQARSFNGDNPVGNISELEFPVHLAAGVAVVDHNDSDNDLSKLTDLSYGKLNRGDANWQSIEKDGVIGLVFEESKTIKEVKLNSLRFTISGVYPPEKIEVFGSKDGKEFFELGILDQSEIALIQGRNKIESKISFEENEVIALKIKLNSIDPIPEGRRSSGRTASILIDEIVVN